MVSARSRPPRLLLSARDPGAAESIAPVARLALASPALHTVLAAQSPALEMFQALGLPVRAIDCEPLPDLDDPARADLLAEADQLLAEVRPDAVITGLSGPGIGIDEALSSRARHLWLYSVQDCEGLVVPGFDGPAPGYFVANDWAARVTRRHPGVAPIVVGSLKHGHYADLAPEQLRKQGRTLLPPASPVIGFFGQVAWRWPGYERSLRRFAQAVPRAAPGALVVYRPHPKESLAERQKTVRLFAEAFAGTACALVTDGNRAVEVSLSVPDLTVSCFSVCGIDQLYLSRQSRAPLGGVLFLLFEPDLAQAFHDDCGRPLPWQVEEGLAAVARDARTLEDRLAEALADARSGRSWQRIQQQMAPIRGGADRVLARVLADLQGPAPLGLPPPRAASTPGPVLR